MKIALYIEDGCEQIVLTPESDPEKKLLDLVGKETRHVKIYRGGFYRCQAGWTRQSSETDSDYRDGVRMTNALNHLSRPTPLVEWLMRAGPIAARLNREAREESPTKRAGAANNRSGEML
jgi:hypothetical protein